MFAEAIGLFSSSVACTIRPKSTNILKFEREKKTLHIKTHQTKKPPIQISIISIPTESIFNTKGKYWKIEGAEMLKKVECTLCTIRPNSSPHSIILTHVSCII